MKVTEAPITEQERQYYKELFHGDLLRGRVKLVVEDDDGHRSETYMEAGKFEALGMDYIRSHAVLRYDVGLEEYFVEIPEDDFRNDIEKNPPKQIRLQFCEIEQGTGREVYRGEDGRYFLREVHFPKERFAKWLICGKRRAVDDGNEPRPNLIFECNGQHERVMYKDWNGVAAYSDTFNPDFHAEPRNTKISFLFRDASNYKVRNECIVAGLISGEQIAAIQSCLMDGEYFKPDMVGLTGETFVDLGYAAYDDDPDFFEMKWPVKESFTHTADLPTVELTVDQLVENFRRAKAKNWC